jgi:hypothetical protein
VISARLIDWLSSDKNHAGDRFSAALEQPLVANGWVVARRGQVIMGRVVTAQKAARASGVSQLEIEVNEVTAVDGQMLPVRTQLVQSSASTSHGTDAVTVGTTTGIGAAIGAAAGGGEGAAIGATAGAAAGIIGVLSKPGKPAVLPSESLLSFRIEEPLEISTEHSEVAFQPVGQGDYGQDQDAYARPGQRSPDGPPRRPYGPYAYPYPYPYAYGYPYPYYFDYGYYPPVGLSFGFYGFSGPRFRGGFRR